MKKISAFAFASLFSLVCLMGCAGTPQEKSAGKMLDMQKQKSALIEKGIVAGLGVGSSQSEQLAYDEADLNARTDAQRMLETKIEALIRNYEEEVGEELNAHKEEVRKGIVSSLQSGVSVIKMDMEVIDGKFKAYVVVAMNSKIIQKALEEQLAARKANLERARAMVGYQKLNEEAAALDAYKEKLSK